MVNGMHSPTPETPQCHSTTFARGCVLPRSHLHERQTQAPAIFFQPTQRLLHPSIQLYDVHDRQRASWLSVNPTLGTSICPWRLAPVPDIGSASRPQRHPLPPNDTRYRFVNEVRSRRATSSLNHHVLHVLFWPSWDLHDSGDFPPVVIWGRHPGRIFP